MNKLTKENIKERDALCAILRDRRSDLEIGVEQFNAAIETGLQQLKELADGHNEAAQSVRDWLEGVVETMQSYFDDRSEKWQESDKASEYQGWMEEYEVSMDPWEVPEIEPVSLDDLEDYAEVVEQLREELAG